MGHLAHAQAIPYLREQVAFLGEILETPPTQISLGNRACRYFMLTAMPDTGAPSLRLKLEQVTPDDATAYDMSTAFGNTAERLGYDLSDEVDARWWSAYASVMALQVHMHSLANTLEAHPELPITSAWGTPNRGSALIHSSLYDPGENPERMKMLLSLQGHQVTADCVRVEAPEVPLTDSLIVQYGFTQPPTVLQ